MAEGAEGLVSAVDVARLAGVTKAAVSNWRRRHADFPAAVGGSASAPLFALVDVQGWLDRTGKGREVPPEVRLWEALKVDFGQTIILGLAAVARAILKPGAGGLGRLSDDALSHALADHGAGSVLGDLADRYVAASVARNAHLVTQPALERVMAMLAGDDDKVVFDPAAGIGGLLFACASGVESVFAQDLDIQAVDFLRARAEVAGRSVTAQAGDSLVADAFGDLRADLVVCHPPWGQAEWGREELLMDPRWEFGLPPKGEGELAWVQHCLAHTAADGRTVIALPRVVAYRRSGRRIRAELVRQGVLHAVVEVPSVVAGMAPVQPAHVWILGRNPEPAGVRMVVLGPDVSVDHFASALNEGTVVPAIELLDDDVDLTPSRHVAADARQMADAYMAARAEFERLARGLVGSLPELLESSGWDRAAMLNVSELARNGLVDVRSNVAESHTDQLDTDFLQGFLASSAAMRRTTSSSGTFRLDSRTARVPNVSVSEQKSYGETFRRLDGFHRAAQQLARLSDEIVSLARGGLTDCRLTPLPSAGHSHDDEESR